MYLLDNLPPYENNNDEDVEVKNKDISKNIKIKSEILQIIYAISFFFVICFEIYNTISFLNVQIEYNNMVIYNNIFNDNQNVKMNIEFKKVSYNTILFLLIFDMILNMLYYMFTNIIIHKNITGARYYVFSSIMCVIIILVILSIVHTNIINKINEYMTSIIMIDSANYYILIKHIRISSFMYIFSYCINIISVVLLI
jgi:hypothetical protein